MGDGEERVFGGRWQVVRLLGRGGQGVVHEVADRNGLPSRAELALMLKAGLQRASASLNMMHPSVESFDDLVTAIQTVVAIRQTPRAALKELLPIDEAVNAKTALERMKAELGTLKSVSHPALIKVLDSRLEERWFVTEYFANGTLGQQIEMFQGNVLAALQAFRPVVEAVSLLHKEGIVHRDIKPDNVFISDSGSLVLGDCGLAMKMEKQDRLTVTFENVGTREYQPGWSYGMRLEDVKPTFDVFSLGKLLWAMVAGLPKFRLWYFDREPNDLRRFCPDPNIGFVHRLLERSVVEHEEQLRIENGAEMLEEVDAAIGAISGGGQIPTEKRAMRCTFCGVGTYGLYSGIRQDGLADPTDRRIRYRCDNCGHVAQFLFKRGEAPEGWERRER